MTDRDRELERIARALLPDDPEEASPELRRTVTRQAELNLAAREHFLATYELVAASRIAKRQPELEISVDGVPHYPVFLTDGDTPSETALSLLKVAAGHRRGWGMALWLAAPNRWLGGRCPVELLDSDPEAVINALAEDLTPIG